MTLKEWCVKHVLTHTHPTTEKGAVSVCVPVENTEARNEVNRLSDFRNDSGTNPRRVVFWFLPNNE